ncbi:MAG: phage resistance protein, partial [bacterium]
MTTYIKDLIDLPEKVHGGDFVLKLTEGVQHPVQTLDPYVVTPQLSECFDAALDFIKGAVQGNSSKAAYLHGSFGSGKSHFMAVLHLLLQQEPAARSKEGLEAVVSKHNPWLEGKKFLLAPYHMIGKASMEEAVLGGYVRRVLELHPEAPIPGVYKAEGLFRDAIKLRGSLGDAAFFERLNRSASFSSSDDAGSSGGWGELEAAWDAPGFEAALEAPPGSDERSRLIGALVEEFFQSYKDVARGDREAFVSLDDGLLIISRHAQSLGYDALVLFLDELILWLATHAADQSFLNTEGPKVSKLVEAENADRPIPIVSFVARQRDLKELVGESVTGAEELGFADVLRWWEARFDRITLEDRNLPEIAARRVLKPRSEAARQQIEQSWRQTETIREEVLETLLTPRADPSVFRKIYPFSPALVETLVAVSGVLQRERTALKV